jgi:trehalose-phosphatase
VSLPDELYAALVTFAARSRVLLGVDFDGTLAPFVTDPMQARATPGSIEALRSAAALPGVTTAVVSGRDVATLALLTGVGADDSIVLIGSHGAESSNADWTESPESEADSALDDAAAARLTAVTADLEDVVRAHPPVRIEHKATAVALHTRGVDPGVAASAARAAREVGTRHTGVHVLPGKDVVELSVVQTSKGVALRALAAARGVEATAYLGDDVTDERAFEVLTSDGDVTIKVGDGETAARHRVPDVPTVGEALETFLRLRTAGESP